jgi:threonine dehydratase
MSQLPSTLPVTAEDIRKAAETIKGSVVDTDFDLSRTLSANLGCEIWLKFENLQFTAAYKERGALNKLASLTEEECERGVIAMSAGNHAQGVAYHASRLGIPSTIVMPEGTPTVKVRNTRKLGAKVILHGQTFDDAAAFCLEHGKAKGLVFIHPFDDPLVIAGQGTIGLEMLRVAPELDTLIVPIGGGGLISGVSIAARSIKPSIEVIGVQASLYPSMYNVIKNAKLPVQGDTLAEGIAVRNPGQITRQIVREMVDDVMLVGENLIEEAVCSLISIEKTVVEGAGAAGLAGIMADPRRFAGKKVGLILCGGNIDTGLLASVLTRDLARQGRLSQLTLDLPDRPGQLARVSGAIGEAGANIVEVYHQRVFTELPARGTELDLVIETRDRDHLDATVAKLEAAGYRVVIKGAGT